MGVERSPEWFWDANGEQLPCHLVLNDSLALAFSCDAGPAFFRAFIVRDRESGKIKLKFRFRYRDHRSWFQAVSHLKDAREATEQLAAGMEAVLTSAAEQLGNPLPEGAIERFYPPDSGADAKRTLEWLIEMDLLEVTGCEAAS